MDKYWVWFSRINKIGAKTQNELLEKYKTPQKIWNLTKNEIENTLTKEKRDILLNKAYKENLEKYMEYMEKNSIKMITIKDKKYPQNLRNIFDPPVVLYVKGNEDILGALGIAIIGSRICSNYGGQIAKQFAYGLSKNNINIISGLAKGIDTYAHIGSIDANKPTIGVLGNGLDMIYPKENVEISKRILQTGGAIISEYIIGTKPDKINFPARNRIISGLSNGILVVEAGKKSGTLITVDFGLEQGKNIYAIPGNINKPTSIGTNELIKQGAKMVIKQSDILEDFLEIYT